MADFTSSKFHARLVETRAAIQRQRARLERLRVKLSALEREEKLLIDALKLVGEEVPESNPSEVAEANRRRQGGKLRAIDAALQVVGVGETVSGDDVAERVQAQGLEFTSRNPRNALGVAMSRSPQFQRIGRGQFRRVKLTALGTPEADEEEMERSDRLNFGS